MPKGVLTISSRNYSSWSLRGWLMCKLGGLDFTVRLLSASDPTARAELLHLSPSFLVPKLEYEGVAIWDVLAIAEFIHESQPKVGLFPTSVSMRAHCRSINGEMHQGFVNLRSALPMNIKSKFPEFKIWAGAQNDIDRVLTIWRDCLKQYGGPYLFGSKPTSSDAMYAPVCSRFFTYDIKLDVQTAEYCKTILAMPVLKEWMAEADAEPEELEELDVEF